MPWPNPCSVPTPWDAIIGLNVGVTDIVAHDSDGHNSAVVTVTCNGFSDSPFVSIVVSKNSCNGNCFGNVDFFFYCLTPNCDYTWFETLTRDGSCDNECWATFPGHPIQYPFPSDALGHGHFPDSTQFSCPGIIPTCGC